jgi:hypothetical protein
MISSRIIKKADQEFFAEKFKRHIPVIVPLWIIPITYGAIGLIYSFSLWMAGLVLAFVVDSCIILPLVSRKHGCVECPQKEQCP